jgi:hypothetical protein
VTNVRDSKIATSLHGQQNHSVTIPNGNCDCDFYNEVDGLVRQPHPAHHGSIDTPMATHSTILRLGRNDIPFIDAFLLNAKKVLNKCTPSKYPPKS